MIFSSNTEGVRVFVHISRFLQLLVVCETVEYILWHKLVVVFDAMDEHRILLVWFGDDVGCDWFSEALFETALELLVLVSVVTVSVNWLLHNDRFVERHVVVILTTHNFRVEVGELVATLETIETAGEFPVGDEHRSHSLDCSLPESPVIKLVVEGFAVSGVLLAVITAELTSRYSEPEEVFCLVSEGAFKT